tara:strand:+ start:664 stop:1137 length:474 start_codon:yes stop_codon:yes gene_type:complete
MYDDSGATVKKNDDFLRSLLSFGKVNAPQSGGQIDFGAMDFSNAFGAGDALNLDGVYQDSSFEKLLNGNVGPKSWLDKLSGYSDVLNAGANVVQAYAGNKQLGYARDSLKESKRQFNANYETQRSLTNTQMRDRQRSLVASNPKHESVESYMKKNGI